jgi:uncharacterized membrane protein
MGWMRSLPILLTATAVLWLAALFAAPTALAQGRLPVATLLVYEAGSRICHQRPERSFKWSGVQMPVCGRCLGLYVGAAVGASVAFATSVRQRYRQFKHGRLAIAIAAVPMALSLALEWSAIAPGTNMSRFISGLPFGGVLAWILIHALASSPGFTAAPGSHVSA